MIFPIAGIPCTYSVQKPLETKCRFLQARYFVQDFQDAERFGEALKIHKDAIFITKASWLSEILFRILSRIPFQTKLPKETQSATAAFLQIAEEKCTLSLVGLLWLSVRNPTMAALKICFVGHEKIPHLDFLHRSAAAARLLRLLEENAASLDDQLEALTLHFPNLLSHEERDEIRRLVRFDQGERTAGEGSGTSSGEYNVHFDTTHSISRSNDSAWMQGLVLVAKIVPVWLSDLSRRYKKDIQTLDKIPEEEIASIAAFGVGGIWLVGLWQRSPASARIKALTGGKNYASAYSVFDYRTADTWGGESALRYFRALCEKHGIRLGCDMVPNHTGIDSLWMREHPEWFMQTSESPFPNYTFNGENLSGDSSIQIRIEDRYYSKSDAAVVFSYEKEGVRRYIYHGNDGTGLPWNDTAQLDHTRADVRQAIIEKALELAENFSIIRFDAAMTLTREHYRRLWFPAADAAPAIASRSLYGLSQEEFDKKMPSEFWHCLVSAFRERQNDTLLIAEAFWMTEMFFVRSLGMHRVYNSAFMHSLRDEKNVELERQIQKFLESDKETLSRFVNYLSTPDEESAAVNFPATDKYFGAMTVMATLPGLPMLAPGQLEGYSEKFAMDQERAEREEVLREDLRERFLKTIAPLFKKRAEFVSPDALKFLACEKSADCIVYKAGAKESHLVVFNNSAEAGFLKISPEVFSNLLPDGSEKVFWRDRLSQKEFSFDGQNLLHGGLTLELRPYASYVFADFRSGEYETKTNPNDQKYWSGVAVPVSALKSSESCGIGEFLDLRLLIDWCALTGQKIINILPINDTGENSSPYSALSAMALHPVYLRLDALGISKELEEMLREKRTLWENSKRIPFTEIVRFKETLLREHFFSDPRKHLSEVAADFTAETWLLPYALYRHLKDIFEKRAWFTWDTDTLPEGELRQLLKEPTIESIKAYAEHHPHEIGFYIWVQYQLHTQLTAVRRYADERGVLLKGDMPIMLERDSVDQWLNGALFNHHLRAGAPPDMFSPEGQNWGFPIYNWAEHFREDFAWWRSRIRQLAKYFSAYRIDHVLGFFRLWCIDKDNFTGRNGFFQPSRFLTLSDLKSLGLSSEETARLTKISLEGAADLPPIAKDGNWLDNSIAHEKGIATLDIDDFHKSILFERLHALPLIRHADCYYPAWGFAEKMGAIPGLSSESKRLLRERVAANTKADAEDQQKQGEAILSALKNASEMLPCAEDLGVVPEYVRPTLAALGILSLKVYRWEAESNIPKDPQGYPYLSLATSSVHDSCNLREWLASEPGSVTGVEVKNGEATPKQIENFLLRLYRSPSKIVMIPLQDLLALDATLHRDAREERINIPGTVSDFNWNYRMPIDLEDLLESENLTNAVARLTGQRPQHS